MIVRQNKTDNMMYEMWTTDDARPRLAVVIHEDDLCSFFGDGKICKRLSSGEEIEFRLEEVMDQHNNEVIGRRPSIALFCESCGTRHFLDEDLMKRVDK